MYTQSHAVYTLCIERETGSDREKERKKKENGDSLQSMMIVAVTGGGWKKNEQAREHRISCQRKPPLRLVDHSHPFASLHPIIALYISIQMFPGVYR